MMFFVNILKRKKFKNFNLEKNINLKNFMQQIFENTCNILVKNFKKKRINH